MIQVKKSDTLIDIVEKIQDSSDKDIILNFPIGHPILHNYLSLKIIKSKSGTKNITIITNDIISRKIGKKLGIHYSIIKDSEYIEQQSVSQENLMKHNFSFTEYLVFELKKYYREALSLVKRNKKINTIKNYSQKYKSYGNIGIFVGLLLISLSLFVFIFYFAINKTTIIIAPEITVKKKARNFIFTENTDFELIGSDKKIKILPIEEKISLSEIYTTTGIEESSIEKSSGSVEISNLLTQEIKLLPATRVMTDDGIIFETEKWVVLPPATIDNFGITIPGKAKVEVISKNYDAEGNFIGEKGNISEGVKMILPGMKDNGTTIFATSIDVFSGGKDIYTPEISKEDLENAELIFTQKLKNEVVKSLKEKIEKRNKQDKTQLDILSVDNIITYTDIEISINDDLQIGDNAESITLNGNIIGKTYTYNQEDVINKLKTVIQESILDGIESILLIDENSLRISTVVSRKKEPLEIKTTVEIDTLVSHDFLSKNNSYTEKLKNTIRGIPKDDAIKLLLNDPKISNVEVHIRPFFLKNISNISENIIFEIQRD